MKLPQVQDSDFVERDGINYVAATINSARCIWREVVHRDLGIDGHIEYVTPDGVAPGRMIAVQVKGGISWFARSTDEHVLFYPQEKHRNYWQEYPLPVVLILHNPSSRETIWVDARESLRVSAAGAPIRVSRTRVFDQRGVLNALECDGPLPVGRAMAIDLIREMATRDHAAQRLCFLDLFAQGMTDVATSIYFSMDVVREVLDVMCVHWQTPSFQIDEGVFHFIDRYIGFLIRNDLCRVDFGAWRQAAIGRNMTGIFIAPLTAKGMAVRDAIIELDDNFPPTLEDEGLGSYSRVIQDRSVAMAYNALGFDEVAVRQRRIERVRASIEIDPA